MQYSFRKIIDRPDWEWPMAITIEVEYDADPVYISEGQVCGGISEYGWGVVAAQSILGPYTMDETLRRVYRMLKKEPAFDAEVKDYCLHDFADRDPCPWPENDI